MSIPSTTEHPRVGPGTDPGSEADAGRARSGRHPVRVGHLVAGLVFLGITLAWALVQADVLDAGATRWLLPVPLLLGGAVGLAVIAARSLRRHDPETSPETETDFSSTDDHTHDRELR